MSDLIEALYTPDERAILDFFFGVSSSDGLNTLNFVDAQKRMGLEVSLPSLYNEAAPGAAAIVLRDIGSRLLNWSSLGTVIGRDAKPREDRAAQLYLLPQLLLRINWATSGPGFYWPMDYHVSWLPGYDRYVVTSSADSVEANHGVCDLALDWFDSGKHIVETSAEIIREDWRAQKSEWDQEQWEELLIPALIDSARASDMAADVWGEEYSDDEGDVYSWEVQS